MLKSRRAKLRPGRPKLSGERLAARRHFGINLKRLRKEAGLSIADVADRFEFRRDHLRDIEEGLRPLSAEFLPDLVLALRLDDAARIVPARLDEAA